MGETMSEKMTGLTPAAVAAATGGTYYGPEDQKEITIASVTIDSRQVEKDSLFVAIKGQRVDGNRFVPGAYESGALCCMSTLPPQDDSVAYVQVESCEQALKDVAEYYRSICPARVIGITGSVGKTSTKEMMASVLSQRFATLKTLGNFNNEIGLPLTILRIRPSHQVAVVEMGISDFGEMSRLGRVARPDACVITNIGQCHLENLGTRDGILKAKTEIFDYLKPGARVYLNGEDDKLITCREDHRIGSPVYYGYKDSFPVYATDIRPQGLAGIRACIHTPKGSFEAYSHAPGRHMIDNAMAAACVALDLGMTLEEISAGIEQFAPVGGHGHVIRTDSLSILNDCYNANPVSMKAGLDVLADVPGRRVAILGDMFELGEQEAFLHEQVGRYAADKRIDVLICIGGLARQYQKGALEADDASGLSVYYFADRDSALAGLPELIRPEDSILVKASHAMGFEKIVEKLREL